MVLDSPYFKFKDIFLLTLLLGKFLTPELAGQSHTHIHESFHMGSPFAITAVHPDSHIAWEAIQAAEKEIERVEALISSWKDSSETSAINRAAGLHPVLVSPELYELIRRSKKVSNLSNGAFDISFASLDKVWKFDGTLTKLPSSEAIAASVAHIDYHNIILDKEKGSVFLLEKGMKIGFGAIGKGYAANRAAAVLKERGIKSGLVNAGGDLISWGTEEDGTPWRIAIADPEKKKTVKAWLEISDQAVVTSGDYERFAEIDGKKYAHIIDPRTGYPVQGIKSVTIICPDAELADALATTVFVLGVEAGLKLVEELRGIECLIIDDQNNFISSKSLHLSYE